MLKNTLTIAALLLATSAHANQTPIVGNVESKCTIYTDTVGVYGNPAPDELSTAAVDGGVDPVIRIDAVQGNAYKAMISWPQSFSTSPNLTDALNWTGDVTVSRVSDPTMSAYETNKIVYDNVVECDLTVAGNTWFTIESAVEYGVGKSLPGGKYTAIVTAECIAK